MMAFGFYFVIFNPWSIRGTFSKSGDNLTVEFTQIFGWKYTKTGKLSDVKDIELLPIATQYGIIGYHFLFKFKDGSESIGMTQMGTKEEALESINELSEFVIGKKADGDGEPKCC